MTTKIGDVSPLNPPPPPSPVPELPPWAAEFPIQLADLPDFIRRYNIRGARVVGELGALTLVYDSIGDD
jgi:hypothetical protein